MLSIDWSEVLEKPDKSFKVPGQLLLQQRNKIESLQKTVDELKAGKAQSDEKASSLNKRIEAVLSDLEAEKKKSKEQAETIEKLKEVVAGLEDNLAGADEKQKQLSSKVEELEGELTSKDTQIAEQTNKLSELQDADTKAQGLEQQLAQAGDLQAKLAEKEAELAALQAKISELEAMAANFDNEKKELQENLQKKIDLLEEEKSSFEEHYKLKEAEAKEKEEQIVSTQKQVEELETQLHPPQPEPAEIGEGGRIKSQIPWKSGTGIFVCPDCGSNRTEDIQDRTKVLYVAAGSPIYAKKKRCLNCGSEWSVD
jgi:chromosome segregation ATPase